MMPRPLLIFSQSGGLIPIVALNSHTEWQKVQVRISWFLKKPTVLDLHCLQRQGFSKFSMTRVNGHRKYSHQSMHMHRHLLTFFFLFMYGIKKGPMSYIASSSVTQVWPITLHFIRHPWDNSLTFLRPHELLMRASDWWSQYFHEKF